MAKVRVNLQFPDVLLKEIDKQAETLNLNRTAYVCMAVSRFIQQDKILDTLPDLLELVKKEKLN